MTPNTRSGREWRVALSILLAMLGRCPCLLDLYSDRAETTPAEKTNEPTPRSMREVPHVSTLAKRRGKMGKSTARMARMVVIIMPPR